MVKSGQVYIDKLDDLLHRNKVLWFFTIFQLILIFLLIIGYLSVKNNINVKVDIPPKLFHTGTLYVGSQKANALYYKVWGSFAVDLISNYSPKTVKKKYNQFMYLLNPQILPSKLDGILQKIKHSKENLVTYSFINGPTKVDVSKSADTGVVSVSGLVTKNIGNDLDISYFVCSYKFKMSIQDYHLYIDDYKKSCQNLKGFKEFNIKKSEIMLDRKYDSEYKDDEKN